jgi:hypothetical protein
VQVKIAAAIPVNQATIARFEGASPGRGTRGGADGL